VVDVRVGAGLRACRWDVEVDDADIDIDDADDDVENGSEEPFVLRPFAGRSPFIKRADGSDAAPEGGSHARRNAAPGAKLRAIHRAPRGAQNEAPGSREVPDKLCES